jgi:hypothetical protein
VASRSESISFDLVLVFFLSHYPPSLDFGGFFESELLGSFELDQNVQGHLRIIPTKWFGQIQLEHENPLF